jgi:hypothetical protein
MGGNTSQISIGDAPFNVMDITASNVKLDGAGFSPDRPLNIS